MEEELIYIAHHHRRGNHGNVTPSTGWRIHWGNYYDGYCATVLVGTIVMSNIIGLHLKSVVRAAMVKHGLRLAYHDFANGINIIHCYMDK